MRVQSLVTCTTLILELASGYARADATQAGSPRQARRTPVVDVFEGNRDAVVNISSTRVVSVRSGPSVFGDWPFSLFDSPYRRPRQYQATSLGSGFVMHASGYIVTNAHVVSRAAELKVGFADGKEYDARVVAADMEHDLAVLKIDAAGRLPTIRLGNSSDLMVGETVVAIGNPFGFKHTVTSGVISAVGRDLDVDEGKAFHDLIQTDASINPGNSGGPLLNILGELIGINTAIRGGAENMAFAIPVDQLLDLLPEMLNIEHLRRVSLGMRVGGREEAQVTEVAEGSPAEEAGIRKADLVQAVDGLPVRRDTDFYFALLEKGPDQPLHIDLLRDGQPLSVKLTIREIPKPDGAALARDLFGLHVQELTAAQCQRIGLRPGVGLLIVQVQRGSSADEIGLAPGDIITSLGRYYVSTMEQLGELLQYVERRDEVVFGGLRIEHGELWRIEGTLRAR